MRNALQSLGRPETKTPMPLHEYGPGKSRRIQLSGSGDRYSTVWAIFSAKHTADIYISPRMLGGDVKVSFHESGSWQVGLTTESPANLSSVGSRHWDIWKRGGELAPGTLRAWYLLIPDQELRVGTCDNKAYKIPPVGADHAASVEFLIMSNEGQTIEIADAHVIGRWRLQGRDESCLIVARRIPWTAELQGWTDAARRQVVAQAEAASIPKSVEYRYFFHGYDVQGVRFGLELAAS